MGSTPVLSFVSIHPNSAHTQRSLNWIEHQYTKLKVVGSNPAGDIFSVKSLFWLKNNGVISLKKRESHFSELTDDEIEKMQTAIQKTYHWISQPPPPKVEAWGLASKRGLSILVLEFPLAQVEEKLKEVVSAACNKITKKGKRYRGFNPWRKEDYKLLMFLAKGENAINGFRNQHLRKFLYPKSQQQRKKYAERTTRRIKLLRAHGLIRKVPRANRYVLTSKGQKFSCALITASATTIKELTEIAAWKTCKKNKNLTDCST